MAARVLFAVRVCNRLGDQTRRVRWAAGVTRKLIEGAFTRPSNTQFDLSLLQHATLPAPLVSRYRLVALAPVMNDFERYLARPVRTSGRNDHERWVQGQREHTARPSGPGGFPPNDLSETAVFNQAE
jgi:hypothetical protein